MKVFCVRDVSAAVSADGQWIGDRRAWIGLAEDAQQAAVFATFKGGVFALDHGDLAVWDHDANRELVTMTARLNRLRHVEGEALRE